jgi:hypothetical protein
MQMAEVVRKFITRAARYVLRPEDRTSLRFSLQQDTGPGGITQTTMLNLSESGVAFLMDPGHHPKIGEHIKVEIPIPNGEQIAWFGRVVRVQEYQASRWSFRKDPFERPKVIVGLRFERLPEGHSRALRRGIEQSFLKAMRDQQYRNWQYYKTLFFQVIPRFVFYFLLTAAAAGFIYYFSLPDGKYDAKRGTPWGERFKF